MQMNQTPSSERVHIGFFGRRNAGKSSIVNAVTAQELREHSHFPDKYYGQPHFLPAYTDGEAILRLNRLRTKVREAELACCRAFADADGKLRRVDILQALNRLSSLCWILMIRCKAGKE